MDEPVAWITEWKFKGEDCREVTFYEGMRGNSAKSIPLYTHPVKEDEGKVCARCGAIAYDPVILQTVKEQLTDEDLEIITEALLMVGFRDDFINYDLKEKALAILRKAQNG